MKWAEILTPSHNKVCSIAQDHQVTFKIQDKIVESVQFDDSL